SFGTDEQAGPNGSSMVAESSAEGLAGADALGVEPAAESLEESSDEQAASVSGSTAAADTATAARRKRSVFMAFSWIEGDVRSGGWWRGRAGRAGVRAVRRPGVSPRAERDRRGWSAPAVR